MELSKSRADVLWKCFRYQEIIHFLDRIPLGCVTLAIVNPCDMSPHCHSYEVVVRINICHPARLNIDYIRKMSAANLTVIHLTGWNTSVWVFPCCQVPATMSMESTFHY